MPRAALAAFTFLALGLALPRLAAADDAMCGVRPAVSLGEGAREAWLEGTQPEGSRLNGMVRDGLLTPAVPVFGAMSSAPVAAPDAAPDAPEILWCASADDPRCAPCDSDAGGSPRLGDGGWQWLVPARAPRVAESPSSSLRSGDPAGRPHPGVSRAIDRPPR